MKHLNSDFAEQLKKETYIKMITLGVDDDGVKFGIKKFKFVGPTPEREFCSKHYNKSYTIEEVKQINNGQGLSVLYFRGGYNCRHRWVADGENIVNPKENSIENSKKNSDINIVIPKGIKLKQHEIDITKTLEIQGMKTEFNPVSKAHGEKSFDTYVNGVKTEFKRLTEDVKTEWRRTRDHISDSVKQGANQIVIKIEKKDFDENEIKRGLKAAIKWDTEEKIKNIIFILPNGKLLEKNRKEIKDENFTI